ncbi:MAG TPA: zinc ribbon domain-containing protein [Pyrinomonadaceae bacterium]|jgi:putative FmdB family regulatory protein
MPIYEYLCRKCGHRFEKIVRGGAEPDGCPECMGRRLEKQLSVFAPAVKGASPRPREAAPASPCGSCGDPRGPGSCSMN